jgi:amino acid transporter
MAVLVGLVFAFIGFYKILTSDKEEEVKKGNQFLIRGTIGVITMVSAGFIANKLAGVGG